jgi:hypothetical protein
LPFIRISNSVRPGVVAAAALDAIAVPPSTMTAAKMHFWKVLWADIAKTSFNES